MNAIRLLRLVAFNVVAVLVLLLLLEGGVRLIHPEITAVGTDQRLVADGRFGDVPGPRPHAVGTSNGAAFRADARVLGVHRE